MTQEEKAKAYDKALSKAKKILESYKSRRLDEILFYAQEDLQGIFPELKESEDEKIRKWLIGYFNQYIIDGMPQVFGNGLNVKDVIAWLEKQGEQKQDPCHTCDHPTMSCNRFPCEKKQGEQKPADKVEPKFRIEAGKWYICISQYCNCIEGRCYQATSDGRIIDDLGTEYDMHSDADKYFRLWTIQDAKDGDVLASEDKVFLYNGKLDLRGRVCAYCGIYKTYDGLRFTKCAIGNYFTYKEPYPATEEQRDTLMKAMTDAGYMWNAGEKKLEKIEPAWSEEDESILQGIWDEILANKHNAKECEWKVYDKFLDWLKSLKDKYTWKPSDEQIKTLEYYMLTLTCDGHKEILFGLMEQLKKLKERRYEKQTYNFINSPTL